jgi:hypothetical protein
VLAQPSAQPLVNADRLAADVRQGRQRHLAAEIRRRIAAAQRGQGVGGLVHGRREQERREP